MKLSTKSTICMGRKAEYGVMSDKILVELLKVGDPNAFTEIYKRYGSLLISFAYRSVLDRQLAKDLVQDLFVDLWARHSEIVITKNLESLVFISLKNRILNHFRHQKVAQKYIKGIQSHQLQSEQHADHLARHKNLSQLIENEIAALPEKMRLVFELNRRKNMSRKEISEFLNMPENAVKTNMQRALKILRRRLGGAFNVILTIF